MKQLFPGIWKQSGKILTKNLVPGKRVYKEQLVKVKGTEYREWVPNRSKAAAAIAKGLKKFPIKRGSSILYLGIANGTTASHFSDIVGPDGVIYGIEISERSLRDLNIIAEERGNIVPILGNAKKPSEYAWIEKVDIIFQDVATDDQPEILIRNCEKFLKQKGTAMLSLKSRSIDVTKSPKDVYKEVEEKLTKFFKIIEKIELYPYEKDHMFFVLKMK